MDEHVLPALIRGDEPIALGRVEPLDDARTHRRCTLLSCLRLPHDLPAGWSATTCGAAAAAEPYLAPHGTNASEINRRKRALRDWPPRPPADRSPVRLRRCPRSAAQCRPAPPTARTSTRRRGRPLPPRVHRTARLRPRRRGGGRAAETRRRRRAPRRPECHPILRSCT